MLIKCPECDLQISDKAISCPHCGYPLKPEKAAKQSQTKRMRLPNGFGQISRINSKNLRNPWRVMVTVGHNEFGKPIQKTLKPQAYFKTYNEAYEALLKYHKNPIDLTESTTIAQLYDKWSDQYFETVSDATIRSIKSAWKWCVSIENIKVQALTKNHLRNLYENATLTKAGKQSTPTPKIKARMKQILIQMFDYAMEYDLVTDNIPKHVPLSKQVSQAVSETKTSHIDFKPEELNIFWQHSDDSLVRMILIGCYSGWRPQELCTMKKENINLEDMTMTAGMKTKSGISRTVPVHPKIENFILGFFQESDSDLLFPFLYSNYNKYSYYFRIKMKELEISAEHRPHDCRVTFITMCKNAGVDDIAIKRFVGHQISDITEAVYTKRTLDWYREEIKKI